MSHARPAPATLRSGTGAPGIRTIGIGASAGSLAALRALLADLPPDPGAAFLVMMHGPPEGAGQLADLLQPHCPMPVLRLDEALPLEPGRVYLVPPDRPLAAAAPELRLAPPVAGPRLRHPIDRLFATLSEARAGDLMGVILTGAASDGTEGLRRVRARGGLALVLDPSEAADAGMPRSAIAAGVPGRILTLAGIRDAILRFCTGSPEPAAADSDTLREVLTVLHAHTGTDLRGYRDELLLHQVRRRMRLIGHEALAAYLAYLREHPEEAAALGSDLLDTRTAFFAAPADFEGLARTLIPRLFDAYADTGQPLRIWCAGCASGEEAYSLAMLLAEEGDRRTDPPAVRIFATDLHAEALGRAREGLYPEEIAKQVSAERLKRFFRREDSQYRVRKELRDGVVFTIHHLLSDPPFSRLDLIVCRGLLPALNEQARQQALARLHYALRPGGWLMLGSGDGPPPEDRFEPANEAAFLWRRRRQADEPYPSAPGHALPPQPRPGLSPRGFSDRHAELHARLAARHAPASVLVDADGAVVHYSAQVGRFLRLPGGAPTHRLPDLVDEPLRGALRRGLEELGDRRRTWQSAPVVVATGAGPERVVLHLEAAAGPGEKPLWLVLFRELGPARAAADPVEECSDELALLRDRLAAAWDETAAERERSQVLEEELRSVNEEYHTVVEELETSREEVHSINEELATLNAEALYRIEMLSQLAADQQHLLEATQIATLFLNSELRIARYTPAATALFNLRQRDRGRPVSDLTHRLDYPDLMADARRVLETADALDREVTSNAGRWYLTRLLPYCPRPHQVEGVVMALVDITERRAAEEALRTADRRKDEFLATLAHELRNALAPLTCGLEVLQMAADAPDLRGRMQASLGRQVSQLARLVDDLLDVSRISRGVLHLRLSRVELAEVVRDAVAACGPLTDAKDQRVQVSLPAEPVLLTADAARLTQALGNLLNNAAKFSPEKSEIELRVEPRDDEVLIAVRDYGVGLEPAALECIFEMFRQVDGDGHAGQGGLGIGLTLARNLAEMHGGSLTAHSEGRGRGSEFTLHLPRTEAPVPSPRVESRTVADARGYRVLIADDNPDVLLSLRLQVELLGAGEVHTARDGAEALEQAGALRPDLVLLDVGMPRMDGCECARRIRAEPWGADPTLVALTGWGQDEDRRRTREAGFDFHLVKPAGRQALQEVFASLQARRGREVGRRHG